MAALRVLMLAIVIAFIAIVAGVKYSQIKKGMAQGAFQPLFNAAAHPLVPVTRDVVLDAPRDLRAVGIEDADEPLLAIGDDLLEQAARPPLPGEPPPIARLRRTCRGRSSASTS